jgi:hypothetical protein
MTSAVETALMEDDQWELNNGRREFLPAPILFSAVKITA